MAQNQISIRIQSHESFLNTSVKIDNAIEKVWYPAVVIVKKDVGTISEKQRWYYFWVVVDICREYHGYSKDEMHQLLKRSFLPDYEDLLTQLAGHKEDIDDVRLIMARFLSLYEDLTITNETTGTFEEYLKRIRETYAQKHNCFIPLPNEDQQWTGWERMQ